jgi:hypothetical protein
MLSENVTTSVQNLILHVVSDGYVAWSFTYRDTKERGLWEQRAEENICT